MHVYICIWLCIYALCVCVSKHYTVVDASSATLFALLRGPLVHVGLEAKTVCSLSAGDGAKVRATRSGRIAHRLSHHLGWLRWNSLWQILLFPRAWSAVSIFAASPAFSSRCYRFLHFNSYPLSLPLTTWSVSVDSFPLISMNLVPLQSINNLPFFFFFFFILCAVQIFINSHVNLCVFPLFLGKSGPQNDGLSPKPYRRHRGLSELHA